MLYLGRNCVIIFSLVRGNDVILYMREIVKLCTVKKKEVCTSERDRLLKGAKELMLFIITSL